jgi:hypothetical protein
MNALSLAHSNIKKQSSMIDDPFDFDSNTFQGLKLVSTKRSLSDYAQELVYNHGTYDGEFYNLSFTKLHEDEQSELVRLYMDSTDRDTSECVHGDDFSIDNDYTCALLALLKNDCQETRDTFADVTRKNVIKYYSKALQDVLNDASITLTYSLNEEHGSFAYQDKDSGDLEWRRN